MAPEATAETSGELGSQIKEQAAELGRATADYIPKLDLKAMAEDVKTLARNNPVPALLTAAALGFLLAKAFSRRD
jgi:hypothetical protein